MNPQHTKSPWTALPAGPHGGAMAFGPDLAPIPQTWANACLIAAAPELLAALEQIRALIDVPGQALVADCKAAAALARAAIAKATGDA